MGKLYLSFLLDLNVCRPLESICVWEHLCVKELVCERTCAWKRVSACVRAFVCERVGSIFYYNAPLKNDEISSFFLVEQNLRDSMNHLQKIVWNASETFHFHSWHVCCKNGHPKIFFRFHKSLFFSDSDSDLTIYGSLSFLKKILFGKFDNF